MTPTSKTQPDPHMQRCHAPLPPSATIQLIYGLLLFAEHDEMTRKTGKTLLPKDFAPRGVICVIVTTQINALLWDEPSTF